MIFLNLSENNDRLASAEVSLYSNPRHQVEKWLTRHGVRHNISICIRVILITATKYREKLSKITFASLKQVSDAVGITGIFAIFGISALLEAIFVYVALPETKNRTLQEIEDYFQVWCILRFYFDPAYSTVCYLIKTINIYFPLQQDNLLWITRSR